jgi:hypothetical protein
MKDMKFNYALIFAVALQFIGLVWYLSKVDSRVSILYDKFEKENEQDVVENQVKMKLDLANLMEDVKAIKKEMRQANKKDREIMEQHEQILNYYKIVLMFLLITVTETK